ncbi:MAG: asparagine synthase-related protein [Acidimicrobiales bacterium]
MPEVECHPTPPTDVPAEPYRMNGFEIACGWVGGGPVSPVARGERRSAEVIEAIEAAILPALLRPPCLVQFSGGRDSSLVLAIALNLARREGLPEPVAITQRFPGIEEADEDDWQEAVVRHLGVTEWERLSWHDELDLVGPYAGPSLLSHGLVWPPLAHTRRPLTDRARGGSFLTGEGGDEVLGLRRATVVRALLAHPARCARRGAASAVAVNLAPRQLRTITLRRQYEQGLAIPWLRPEPRAALLDDLARQAAAEPLDWREAIRRHPACRGVFLGMRTLDLFALESGVHSVHPLLDAGVLAALGSAGGVFGFPNRTQAMRRLFGGLLPDDVLARQTKARFNKASFGIYSRSFAREWTGTGVDTDLVDPEALAATWADPEPHAMSYPLLQSCWLSSHRSVAPTTGPDRTARPANR